MISRLFIPQFLSGAAIIGVLSFELCQAEALPPEVDSTTRIAIDRDSIVTTDGDSTTASIPVDSVLPLKNSAVPAAVSDSLPAPVDSVKNAINLDSSAYASLGIGLSVGSVPLFALWEKGLPRTLADLSLADSSFALPGDSSKLSFSVKESPDVYNMVFPVFISFGRFTPDHRFGGGVSFAMLSKKFTSSIRCGSDTAARLDVKQRFSLYTVSLDLVYGWKIPERYFSVDGVDRTDAVLGLSVAPLAILNKSSSFPSTNVSTRLDVTADSLPARVNSFSACGIAIGWRAGIVTVKKASASGGFEAGLAYSGIWQGRFRTDISTAINERDVSRRGSPHKAAANISHRMEMTVAMVRRVF